MIHHIYIYLARLFACGGVAVPFLNNILSFQAEADTLDA